MLASPPNTSTPTRLLDAAERLFGSKGLDGTSVREIAQAAEANLAAAHYHFGSKEKLYEAVFLRRVRPLNEERLAKLRVALALPLTPAERLEPVVESFVEPALRISRSSPAFIALLGRNLTAPPPFMHEVMAAEFAPVVQAYRPALQASLPHLPPAEIFWRMNFLVGALIHTAANFPVIGRMAEQVGGVDPAAMTSLRLTRFAVAGLRAEATTLPTP